MTRPDLLVIGGGAAGLSAAATAQEAGLLVTLLDERPALGGNYYAGAEDRPPARPGTACARVAGFIAKASAGGIALERGSFAWRIETDGRTHVLDAAGIVRSISPKRLLIATGAMERPVPIPGAMLPGVMYAGAAQLMLKTAGAVPAGRAVLVGSGPLLLLLAKQLLSHGAAPAAIVDTTPPAGPAAALGTLPAGLKAPGLLTRGLGLVLGLMRAGIPWHRGASGVAIHGRDRAETVVFTDRQGNPCTVEAELVLVHDGIIPNDQITRQLGCDERWNAKQHCFHPVVNAWGETSRPGIFAAGDCTGIWGAEAAELSGMLAALEIARQVGGIDGPDRDRRAASFLRRRAKLQAFRPFLEARFPPALSRAGLASPDTVICRCESVTAGDIRTAIAQGATGPDQLKSFTRCGMGPCQGRSCSMAVAEILAAETGRDVGAVGRQDIRPPLKPLPLGAIAAAEVEAEDA